MALSHYLRSFGIHLRAISLEKLKLSILDMSLKTYYRQTSNISRTLLANEIVDHSDVVGASPVGAALTISSFMT